MALGPSYNIPKIHGFLFYLHSTQNKRKIYLTNDLNPEARLQNGKVLSTHSTHTKFGLLNSCDQCTFLCMSWMICWTCKKNQTTQIFLWMKSLLLKRIRSVLVDKKNEFDSSKYQICFVIWRKSDFGYKNSDLFCDN